MDNGAIRIYKKEDIEAGKAIGLQNRAYVRQVDLIDSNCLSMLIHSKVFKWESKTKITELGEGQDSQLRSLPIVIKLPDAMNTQDLYFAIG